MEWNAKKEEIMKKNSCVIDYVCGFCKMACFMAWTVLWSWKKNCIWSNIFYNQYHLHKGAYTSIWILRRKKWIAIFFYLLNSSIIKINKMVAVNNQLIYTWMLMFNNNIFLHISFWHSTFNLYLYNMFCTLLAIM